jgi:hypothetical protein
VTPFEAAVAGELSAMVRAGVPVRGIRLTVRDLMVTRIGRGPIGAREVSDAVEDAVRAACRLVRERGAPDEVVEAVCRAALDAVRGHGGESARWLDEATGAVTTTLDVLARERADEPGWRWLARRVPQW